MEKLYIHFILPLYINYAYQNYKHEPCNKADKEEQILPTQKHHIVSLAYYNSTQRSEIWQWNLLHAIHTKEARSQLSVL